MAVEVAAVASDAGQRRHLQRGDTISSAGGAASIWRIARASIDRSPVAARATATGMPACSASGPGRDVGNRGPRSKRDTLRQWSPQRHLYIYPVLRGGRTWMVHPGTTAKAFKPTYALELHQSQGLADERWGLDQALARANFTSGFGLSSLMSDGAFMFELHRPGRDCPHREQCDRREPHGRHRADPTVGPDRRGGVPGPDALPRPGDRGRHQP